MTNKTASLRAPKAPRPRVTFANAPQPSSGPGLGSHMRQLGRNIGGAAMQQGANAWHHKGLRTGAGLGAGGYGLYKLLSPYLQGAEKAMTPEPAPQNAEQGAEQLQQRAQRFSGGLGANMNMRNLGRAARAGVA